MKYCYILTRVATMKKIDNIPTISKVMEQLKNIADRVQGGMTLKTNWQ